MFSHHLLSWACRTPGRGIIVNYHTLDATQTRRHVEMLSRHFDFIHHDELPQRIDRPGARPFCLVTFDDGKRSHAVETAPVLKQLGVPAVFYLVTGFVSDGTTPLWFDRYEALQRKLSPLSPELNPRAIKRLPLAIISERLDRVCKLHGIDADFADDTVRPMSWDDAVSLHRQGHTIGAHTSWHAILTNESFDHAATDLRQSLRAVSTHLGTACKTFSFPNGNGSDELVRTALSCGVRTIMTTDPVWVARSTPLWHLPRIQLFPVHSENHCLLKLAAASFGWTLVNPNGTGRRYARHNPNTASPACPGGLGRLAPDGRHHRRSGTPT